MGMLKMFLRYGEVSVMIPVEELFPTLERYKKQGLDITSYSFERI